MTEDIGSSSTTLASDDTRTFKFAAVGQGVVTPPAVLSTPVSEE